MEEFKRNSKVDLLMLCAGLIYLLSRLIWASDAAFVWDEAKILKLALDSSAANDFYPLGLLGTRGYHYGPFPIWFYRSLLWITHDIFFLSLLKITMVSLMTVASFFWMSITFNKSWKFPYILLLLSPYLWFYERNLWDNSLNIALGFFVFATYCSFIKRPDYLKFLLIFLGITFMFLTHLMALPFIIGTGVLILFESKNWIFKNKFFVIFIFIAILGLVFPYLKHLIFAPKSLDAKPTHLSLTSLVFPLFATRFFSFFDYAYFLGKDWQNFQSMPAFFNSIYKILSGVTIVATVFYWNGIYQAFKKIFVSAVIGRNKELTLALFILLLNIGLCFIAGLRSHPHYYNGFIVIPFIFCWHGLEGNFLKKLFKGVKIFWPILMLVFFIDIFLRLHIYNGSKSLHYGPTLKNQVKLASEWNQLPDTTLVTSNALHPRQFPEALSLLRILKPANTFSVTNEKVFPEKILLDYSSADQKNWGGEIIFVQQ